MWDGPRIVRVGRPPHRSSGTRGSASHQTLSSGVVFERFRHPNAMERHVPIMRIRFRATGHFFSLPTLEFHANSLKN
jgi:hypothetical protein